jgi:hypothetical protein
MVLARADDDAAAGAKWPKAWTVAVRAPGPRYFDEEALCFGARRRSPELYSGRVPQRFAWLCCPSTTRGSQGRLLNFDAVRET